MSSILDMKLGKSFRWRTANFYLLLIIIILGAILRFYRLGAPSFWYDEISSITAARQGFRDLSNPPLSFVILWIFLEIFGTNEFTVRLPACLFGIGTIYLVYLFGKQLFGEREGLVSSFIISISPWYIRWSQEARMYTEFTFLTILALYFFYKATQKENSKFYGLSLLFMALAFYTHYAGISIPIIIVSWLTLMKFSGNKEIKINFEHFEVFFEFYFILCVPLIFNTIPRAMNVKFGGKEIRWGIPTIEQFFVKMFIIELGWIVSILSILGAAALIFKRKKSGSFLSLYAAIPFLAFALLVPRMNVAIRYVIFTLPAYALLTSYILIEILKRIEYEVEKGFPSKTLKIQTRIIFSIGVVLGLVFGMNTIPKLSYYYVYGMNPDWRGACAYVESMMDTEDVITSTATNIVEYYLGRVDYKLSADNFGKIKNSHRRVWMIIEDWILDEIDPDHEFQDWMASNCQLMHQAHRVDVYLFDPL